jgi:hypothetical protein
MTFMSRLQLMQVFQSGGIGYTTAGPEIVDVDAARVSLKAATRHILDAPAYRLGADIALDSYQSLANVGMNAFAAGALPSFGSFTVECWYNPGSSDQTQFALVAASSREPGSFDVRCWFGGPPHRGAAARAVPVFTTLSRTAAGGVSVAHRLENWVRRATTPETALPANGQNIMSVIPVPFFAVMGVLAESSTTCETVDVACLPGDADHQGGPLFVVRLPRGGLK